MGRYRLWDYECAGEYDSLRNEQQRLAIIIPITVGMIVEALAAGRTVEHLLADFPYIEEPDIREALAFAASLAQGHEIRLAS